MWNQNWGSMIWGRAHAVPVMGPLSLMLLAMGLMVSGWILLRDPAMRRLMGIAMVLLGLLVPISTFAVPFTFTNGTVADATQVNQNFASLDANKTLAFAHVNSNGTIDSDSGNITVVKVDAGLYCAAVSSATPRVAVASLDGRANVGGSVQAGVFAASVCPSTAQQIFIVTRPQNQDGGTPGQDRAFYLLVN
jgi:hypothetical protein